MAISLYISETTLDAELQGVIGCATATGGNGSTVAERQLSEAEPGTPTEMSMSIANGVDDAVVMRFGFDPPDNYGWDAGTWSIYLGNVTTADQITLTGVWICRTNASGVSQETLGSNQSLNISLNSTGAVNSGNPINVTVSGTTPNAGDQILVNFVADNVASHGVVTAGITFSGATPWSATLTPSVSVSPNPLSLNISAVTPKGMTLEDVYPAPVTVGTSIPIPLVGGGSTYLDYYVNTDSGSSSNGGTDPDTDAWATIEDAVSVIEAANLVSTEQIGRLWCAGSGADTGALAINASGTSASYYWEIHGEGATNTWDTTKYRIDNTTDFDGIDIQGGYVNIMDMQIKIRNSTGTFTTCIQHAGADVVYVDRCYLEGDWANSGTDSLECVRNQGGGTMYLRNVIGRGANNWHVFDNATGTMYAYHCVATDATGGNNGFSATVDECWNCIGWNNSGNDFGAGIGGNFNASEDTTAPGADSFISISDPFVNSSTGNYALANSATSLHRGGFPLFFNDTLQVKVDIDGTTRTFFPSIGAVQHNFNPTVVHRYVDTDSGSSGNDGTSWAQAWNTLATAYTNLSARDLVTNNEILRIHVRGATAENGAVDFVLASTTDAQRYWEIVSEDDHGGVWSTSAYRLTTSGDPFDVNSGYVHASGIQVQADNATANPRNAVTNQGAGDVHLENCILQVGPSDTDATHGFRNEAGGGRILAVNTIIYRTQPVATWGGNGMEDSNNGGSSYAINTTVEGFKFATSEYGFEKVHCYNCIGYDNGTDFSTSPASTGNYNAGSDTSAPGAQSIDSISDPFVDSTNHDFHLSSGATTLHASGFPLVGHPTGVNLSFDIEGDSRVLASPSIGADEYTTTGAPQSVAPSALSLTTSAIAPSLTFGVVTVAPTAQSLTVSTVAPSITTGTSVSPSAVLLTASTVAPSITLGAITVAPTPVSLSISTVSPVVTAGGQAAAPGPISLTVATAAPVLTKGAVEVAPSAVVITFATPPPSAGVTTVVTPSPIPLFVSTDWFPEAVETFTRTEVDTWGIADKGGYWYQVNKDTPISGDGRYDVSGGVGLIHFTAEDIVNPVLNDAYGLNVSGLFRFKIDTFTDTGGHFHTTEVYARRDDTVTDGNNFFRYAIRLHGDGTIKIRQEKNVGGTTSFIDGGETTISPTWDTVNDWFWVRFECIGVNGTTHRLKVWKDGTSEPSAWQKETFHTETNLDNPGTTGFRTSPANSQTTFPIDWSFDDLNYWSDVRPSVTIGAVSVAPTPLILTTSVPIPAIGGTQSVTPATISLSISAIAPAISVGAVSVSPSSLSTTVSTVAPTISLTRSVSPSPISLSISPVAPTVAEGEVSASPNSISTTISTVAPTVTEGAVSVSPAPVSLSISTVAPTVSEGAISVAPSPVSLTISTVAPTVTKGAVSVFPAPLSLSISTVAPDTDLSQTVNPAAVSLAASTVAPTISVSLAPAPVVTTISTVTPSVAAGAQIVSPSPVSLSVSTVAPTTSVGEVTVAPSPVSLAISTQAPSISLTASVSPSPVSLSVSTVAPDIDIGQAVSPSPISLNISTVAPSTSVGEVTVAPTAVSTTISTVAPTTSVGAVTVTPSPISLSISTVAPVITTGSDVAPSPISLTTSVVAPSISLGAVSVTPAPVVLAISTQAPTTSVGAVTVEPTPVVLNVSTVAPTIDLTKSVSPSAVLTTISTTTPTLDIVVAPAAVLVSISIPTPSAETGVWGGWGDPDDFFVNVPSALVLTVSIPDPVASTETSVSPAPLVLTVSTVVPSVGGATTVTPAPVVLSVSTVAPSVAVGAVSVSPDPVSLSISTVAPAVAKGAVSVSPTPLSLAVSVPTPSIAVGAREVTPSALVLNLSIPTPSVTGAEFVTPSALSLTVSVQAPTVSVGAVSVSPDSILLDVSTVAPSTAQDIYPDTLALTVSTVAPSVSIGAVSVTPSPLVLSVTTVAPSIEAGTSQVNPSPVGLTISTVAPSIALGAVSVSPSPISLSVTTVAPAVTEGAVSVSPSALLLTTSVQTPSVAVGAVSVAPDPVILSVSTVAPATEVGAVSASPASLVLTTTTVAPSVSVGAVTVSPDSLTLSLSVPAPSTTTIFTATPDPVILSVSTVAPSISTDQTVSPSAVGLTISLVTPDISNGKWGGWGDPDDFWVVVPTPISLAVSTVAPTAAPGAISVSPTPLTLAISTQTPATVVGERAITPDALVLNTSVAAPQVAQGAISVSPDPVVLSIVPVAPTATTAVTVSPDTLVLTTTTVAPSITLTRTITPAPVVLSLSVPVPGVGGALQVTPDPVSMATSTVAPSVAVGAVSVAPEPLTVTITTVAPTIGSAVAVAPDSLILSLALPAPLVLIESLVAPDPVALSVTTGTPATVVGPVSVSPSALVLSLSTVAPVAEQVVNPDSLVLSLSTVAPSLSSFQELDVEPVSLSISTVAPTIARGAVVVTPDTEVLTVTPVAPTVLVTGATVHPDTITLSLTVPTPAASIGAAIVTPDPVVLTLALPAVTLLQALTQQVVFNVVAIFDNPTVTSIVIDDLIPTSLTIDNPTKTSITIDNETITTINLSKTITSIEFYEGVFLMSETYDLIWAATDTLPIFTATLYNGDGNPLDLQNSAVKFVLAKTNGTSVGEYDVTIVDDVNGQISFDWDDTETDNLKGEYVARIRVDWTNNESIHVPNDDWLSVLIT